MTHNHEHCCEHEHMAYCKVCKVAYCKDCGQEWHAYTFTWGNSGTWIYPAYGTSDTEYHSIKITCSTHEHDA